MKDPLSCHILFQAWPVKRLEPCSSGRREQGARDTHSFRVPFHAGLGMWTFSSCNLAYILWEDVERTYMDLDIVMLGSYECRMKGYSDEFNGYVPRFILLFTLIPIYFRFLHFLFTTPPLLFLYYCSLVNPVYVFLTLCNLLSLICDLPPLTDSLSTFLSQWFSWLLCIGFSIQILHMNKRKWELPEICTEAERHKIMASWDKREQAHREKRRCLLKRRLDIGISYTRGKADLDENNKKEEGNGCLAK